MIYPFHKGAFEVSIALLTEDGRSREHLEYRSDSLPDLCAVAATLREPFEITVYTGFADGQDILEEHDEPGDKGNYGGIWHTIDKYAPSTL